MNTIVFPTVTDRDRTLPLYVTSVGGWENQAHVHRENGYPDYHWIQCISGKGTVYIGNERHTVRNGSGMFLTAKIPHEYYPIAEPWKVVWVTFNGSQATDIVHDLQLTKSTVYPVSNPRRMVDYIQDIIVAYESDQFFGGLTGSSLLYQLLLDIYQSAYLAEKGMRHDHYAQLAPVFRYIEQHYAKDISLHDLAQQLSISAQHTCYLFQRYVQVRPIEYVTRFRMRKAKERLLQDATTPVKEIAEQVGYRNPSYFIKLFKKYEGMPPAAFRKFHSLR